MASPIDGQKFSLATSLGTSIDSAMVTDCHTNNFAKNRFLSGDHVNANNRDALLRRQLFAIGKLLLTKLKIVYQKGKHRQLLGAQFPIYKMYRLKHQKCNLKLW